MKLEHKSIDIELKQADGGGFTWEGYVAAFDNIDAYNDVIVRGAFADDVGNTVPAYFEHEFPVGKMFVVEEDQYGLKVRGELAPDSAQDPRVGNLSERLRWFMSDHGELGSVTYKMSIGYYVLDADREMRDGKSVRYLTKLKLEEGSIVLHPANDKAIITDHKSADDTITIEKIETMTERELEAAFKSGAPMSGNASKKLVSLIKAQKSDGLQRILKALHNTK